MVETNRTGSGVFVRARCPKCKRWAAIEIPHGSAGDACRLAAELFNVAMFARQALTSHDHASLREAIQVLDAARAKLEIEKAG